MAYFMSRDKWMERCISLKRQLSLLALIVSKLISEKNKKASQMNVYYYL